jgi:hypothetical protein
VATRAHGALRFHDLLHSYATWLVSDGVPVNVVQKVMGHEQASTTLNRYTYAPDDYEALVRDAFESSAEFPLSFDLQPGAEIIRPMRATRCELGILAWRGLSGIGTTPVGG